MLRVPSRIDPSWWQHVVEVADRRLGSPRRSLAELVAETSALYTTRRDAIDSTRRGDALQARMRFFMPRDLIKVLFPLDELRRAGRLPTDRTWRVLDLGCGLGTTTFGVSWFARLHDVADALHVCALDVSDEALELFAAIDPPGVPLQLDSRVADVRARPTLPKGFDLVVLGLVLNELDGDAEKLATVRWAAEAMAPGGAMIVLEPALREPTRALQRVRDALALQDDLHVFAPCLHEQPCPMLANERDWCHEERPFELPEALVPVARAAKLRSDRSTFSYLSVCRTPRPTTDAFRVVSSRLKTKGKLELIVCRGDGELEKLRRLDRHATEANAAFGEAKRGDVLERKGTGRIDPDEQVTRG